MCFTVHYVVLRNWAQEHFSCICKYVDTHCKLPCLPSVNIFVFSQILCRIKSPTKCLKRINVIFASVKYSMCWHSALNTTETDFV
jgi:hypothetical protein